MKIFVICSKAFYDRIPTIKQELENMNHVVSLPNCYDNPETESKYRDTADHGKWKAEMFRHSEEVIKENDAVLVLNFAKNGIENYIGGATFLEMYDAFKLNKTIYMYNQVPEGLLKDEIIGLLPIILDGDLSKINDNDLIDSENNFTLSQAQQEVDVWANQFETPYFEPLSMMAAMTEECGEVARVLNRMYGNKKQKDDETIKNLEEELGDMLFTLICVANAEGIDLNKSFERKMNKVYKRDNNRWSKK